MDRDEFVTQLLRDFSPLGQRSSDPPDQLTRCERSREGRGGLFGMTRRLLADGEAVSWRGDARMLDPSDESLEVAQVLLMGRRTPP